MVRRLLAKKNEQRCQHKMLAKFLNRRQTFVCQYCWQTRWPTFVGRVSAALEA